MKTTNKLNSKGDLYAPAVALNGEYTKLHSDVCIREDCTCFSHSQKPEHLPSLLTSEIRNGRHSKALPLRGITEARRMLVTGTEYSVTYLEYKGKLMDRPMKAAFAFFKGIPHSTEVARNKMIAQNLGLTVHSGAAKKVLSAKYVPHQGKREQQRRAKQLARQGATVGNNTPDLQQVSDGQKSDSKDN